MKESKPFEMPPAVLKQVLECSDGGALVAWIDQKGEVNLFHSAETETKFLALITHLTHFTNAIHSISTDSIVSDMMSDELPESEEDEQ